MKKLLTIAGVLVVLGLLAALVSSAVLADSPSRVGSGYSRARWAQNDARPSFVDEDGDGVCDLCGAQGEGGYHGRRFGWNQSERPFVDEDGDGVCDNFSQRLGRGFGRGGLNRGGIDEDGDGLCDICGEPLDHEPLLDGSDPVWQR